MSPPDPLLEQELAITTVSIDAADIYIKNLTATKPPKWGMGPALTKYDAVLMYIPKQLVPRLGFGDKYKQPGFYGLYRVAAETREPEGKDFPWRHEVDLTARIALDPPITLDDLRDDPVLNEWGLQNTHFRAVGQLKEAVEKNMARALWRLILKRVIPKRFPDIETFLAHWFELEPLRGATSIGDEPATVDLLGRRDLVNALAAMLDHPGQGTPFTIGLLGKWGTGKTSVMTQLQEALGGGETKEDHNDDPERLKQIRHEFIFAWFNAWEYEKTDNIGAGLAQEVVQAVTSGKSVFGRWWLQFRFAWTEHRWQFALALAYPVVSMALAVVAGCLALKPELFGKALTDTVARVFGGTFAFGLAAVGTRLGKRVRELWNHPLADKLSSYLKLPDYEKHLGLIPVLRRHLRILCSVRGIRRREPSAECGPRLVVFVDDLDRCGPEAIVQTFDAIRLVMGIPEVVVIIGIDAGIAFRAVGSHYQKLVDSTTSPAAIARDFLGKIIQLPIRLGRPSNLGPFVKQLFSAAHHEELGTLLPPDANDGGLEPTGPALGDDAKTGAGESHISENGPGKGTITMDTDEREPVQREIHVELDRDMEHSPEEAEQFQKLAEDFGFDNPRQLLRLRNSYRLLKVFDVQRARRLGQERFGPTLVMASLFWQEFLLGCPPALRQACKEAISTGNPCAEAEPITKSFLARLADNSDWDHRLDEAGAFVSQLVLPCGFEPALAAASGPPRSTPSINDGASGGPGS